MRVCVIKINWLIGQQEIRFIRALWNRIQGNHEMVLDYRELPDYVHSLVTTLYTLDMIV